MHGLTKNIIHGAVVEALSDDCVWHDVPGTVPFRLRSTHCGDLMVYGYTLTLPKASVGVRPSGEYRIQVIQPGQERGRHHALPLEYDDQAFTVLLGWTPIDRVFVLWDAYAHDSFVWSQNVQIQGEAIWGAALSGLTTSRRQLRGGRGVETAVACRADRLLDGLALRQEHTFKRFQALAGNL
jgi:hypothetical protein